VRQSPEEGDTIATPRVAAGVLFRDDRGGILLVRPTYKPFWDLPGGYVEPGESPRAAAIREVAEELGLKISAGPLLSVDWAPNGGEGDKLLFVFDGGSLDAEDRRKIQHDDGEVDEWRFIAIEDLDDYTIPRLAQRLRSTVGMSGSHPTSYLEHGVPVDHQ
jgi:8-oxo-dGTP pyrophosphatase MutT (NUDIX family)